MPNAPWCAAAIKIQADAPLDRACLVGCGVMTDVGAGLNVIQGAVLCRAGRIIAVDLMEQKLSWAKAFGATALVELYMHKRLKLDELISRRIKLAEVNTAFEAMEKGEVVRSVIVHD